WHGHANGVFVVFQAIALLGDLVLAGNPHDLEVVGGGDHAVVALVSHHAVFLLLHTQTHIQATGAVPQIQGVGAVGATGSFVQRHAQAAREATEAGGVVADVVAGTAGVVAHAGVGQVGGCEGRVKHVVAVAHVVDVLVGAVQQAGAHRTEAAAQANPRSPV